MFWRNFNGNYLIDDHVARSGYYWVVKSEDGGKPLQKRTWWTYAVNLGVFAAVCGYIWMLWGWQAALIFMVFPLNVSGWAWVTGNYYMSTVLLVLSAYGLTSYGLPVGVLYGDIGIGMCLLGVLMYWSALESTVTSFGWLFYALVSGFWQMVIPFLVFVNGKRFAAAIIGRDKNQKKGGVEGIKLRLGNFLVTIPYYVYITLVPYKLGFFHSIGKRGKDHAFGFKMAGLAMLVAFSVLFIMVDWKMWVWWIGSYIIFSQVFIFGQYWSERYTFLGNVAWAVVTARILDGHPVLLAVYVTVLACISWDYVPAWKDSGALYSQSISNFPDCADNYINLTSWYFANKRYGEAIKPLMCAERLVSCKKGVIWGHLAHSYGNLGNWEECLKYTQLALTDAPSREDYESLMRQQDDIIRRMPNRLAKRYMRKQTVPGRL